MSINPIQSSPASLPALLLQGHGHKKGVHGDTQPEATRSGTNPEQGAAHSTQSLFGSLLDSVEQLIGISPASAAKAAATRSAAKM